MKKLLNICIAILLCLCMKMPLFAQESTYKGSVDFNIYLSVNGANNPYINYSLNKNYEKKVAYCFNEGFDQPNYADGYRVSSEDDKNSGDYNDMISYKKYYTSEAMIRRIIAYGYPNTTSEFFVKAKEMIEKNSKFNNIPMSKDALAGELLRAATQYAIWAVNSANEFFALNINNKYDADAFALAKEMFDKATVSTESYSSNNTLYRPILNAGNTSNPQNLIVVEPNISKVEIEIEKLGATYDESFPLTGSELAVYQGETLIESWVTNGISHKLSLEPGLYTLKELNAPEGYEKVSDIQFEVSESLYGNSTVVASVKIITSEFGDVTMGNGENGSYNKLVLIDKAIEHSFTLRKVDEEGNVVVGAELEIFKDNETGNIAKGKLNGDEVTDLKWKTEGNDIILTMMPGNYIFHEQSAPEGYDKVNDFKFTVDYSGNITLSQDKTDCVYYEDGVMTVVDKKQNMSNSQANTDKDDTQDDENEDKNEIQDSKTEHEDEEIHTGNQNHISMYILIMTGTILGILGMCMFKLKINE